MFGFVQAGTSRPRGGRPCARGRDVSAVRSTLPNSWKPRRGDRN